MREKDRDDERERSRVMEELISAVVDHGVKWIPAASHLDS